jgi:outer membrane protein insertion porin family
VLGLAVCALALLVASASAQPVSNDPVAAPSAPEDAPAAAEPPPLDEQVVVPRVESEAADPDEQSARPPIRYFLERVEIRGNRTRRDVIEHFVPLERGELFDVDDPSIERIRWRLLGTGYFHDVKLSLARGSTKGWVVLIIEVQERNTLVIDRLVAGLSRVVNSSGAMRDELRPYGGLGVAETNFLGLGLGISGAAVVSQYQYGLNFGYHDPMLGGSGFSLSGRVFHNYAREFFGRNPLIAVSCPSVVSEDPDDPCNPSRAGKRAVVIYHRTGAGFGTGHDISSTLRYTLDWLGEHVDVGNRPRAASTQRGAEIVPIDFRIQDGVSYVSSLRLGLIYDHRDSPTLTRRGSLASFRARIASGLLGSSYDFVRLEAGARHFLPLPWGHVLSLGAFAGTVFGEAPFFYDFYAADLSDLLPSRVLELNLDHRHPPNLLGTSIAWMDMEDLAARIDFEYELPLHRGGGFVRGVDAYWGAGLYMLAPRDSLRVAIAGYEGLAALPLDLTFDVGIQADTELGLIRLGFSTLIGFLPAVGEGSP